jgi:hypothetical protein
MCQMNKNLLGFIYMTASYAYTAKLGFMNTIRATINPASAMFHKFVIAMGHLD